MNINTDKALIIYGNDDTFLRTNFFHFKQSFEKYLQLNNFSINNVCEMPSMLVLSLPSKKLKYPSLGYIQKKDLKKPIKKLNIVADQFLTIEELKNKLGDYPFLYNCFLGTLFLKKHKKKIILVGILGIGFGSAYMLIKYKKILSENSKMILKNFRELIYPKISKTVIDLTLSDSLEVIDTPIRVLNRLKLEDLEKKLAILYEQQTIAILRDYVYLLAKVLRIRKRKKILMSNFQHLDQLLFLSQLSFPSSFFEDMDITKLTPIQILLHFKDIRAIFLHYVRNLKIIRELDELDRIEKSFYKKF